MSHRFLVLVVVLAAVLLPSPRLMAEPSRLISEATAARHGLTRPWFAQGRSLPKGWLAFPMSFSAKVCCSFRAIRPWCRPLTRKPARPSG